MTRRVDGARCGEYLELGAFQRIFHVEKMHLPDPTPDNRVETGFEADGSRSDSRGDRRLETML